LYHISVWDIAKIGANGIWNSANRMKANTKKAVLFEKKNQKTFNRSSGACRIRRANQNNKSFLFLFFKKEILPCFPSV
jgi:hypothetical protein